MKLITFRIDVLRLNDLLPEVASSLLREVSLADSIGRPANVNKIALILQPAVAFWYSV
jgi:hypothetical protein